MATALGIASRYWLAAGLALAPGCARPLSLHAVAGQNLGRPAIADVRGALPVDAGLGGLAGGRASIGLGHSWALQTEIVTVYERFSSRELPTDSPVRLTSLASSVSAAFTPRRGGRVAVLGGVEFLFPVRVRRAFRDEDQDVLADYRAAAAAVVTGVGAWLDSTQRARAEVRYVAGITNLDATGWYDLRRRSLEVVGTFQLCKRDRRP